MRFILCILLFGLGGRWSAYGDNGANNNTVISATVKNETAQSNSNVTSYSGAETLIVGGDPATRNEYPWLVHMNISVTNGTGLCGGSLIDLDLVLTAAHCVVTDVGDLIAAENISVTAGDHYRSRNDGTEQTLIASCVKIHEKYNYKYKNSSHDIALVKLSKMFNKTFSVSPIDLPTSNSSGNECGTANGIVAGWGFTREDATDFSDVLRKVQVPVDTTSYCDQQKTHTDGQFCAGEHGKDSCDGDSGGPFICNNTSNAPKVIRGIVSYGPKECGLRNFPGVYTRVSTFVPWIKKNLDFSSSSGITITSSKLLITLPVVFTCAILSSK